MRGVPSDIARATAQISEESRDLGSVARTRPNFVLCPKFVSCGFRAPGRARGPVLARAARRLPTYLGEIPNLGSLVRIRPILVLFPILVSLWVSGSGRARDPSAGSRSPASARAPPTYLGEIPDLGSLGRILPSFVFSPILVSCRGRDRSRAIRDPSAGSRSPASARAVHVSRRNPGSRILGADSSDSRALSEVRELAGSGIRDPGCAPASYGALSAAE